MSKDKANTEQEIKEETIASKDTEVREEEIDSSNDSEKKESSLEEGQEDQETDLAIELEEAKDKYLRLYSEFENFRRRTSKEKLELISTANKELMSDLLPVLDDFERAMNATEKSEDLKAVREGISLVQNKLNKSLENKGLKKMKVKKGDEFDDEKHEAITQIPAEKKLEGKVVDVIEAGYTLGESVVRFAKVVVGAKQ